MWKKALPFFAVVGFLLAANGILAVLLPLRWSHAGISPRAIAWLAACNYGGGLLCVAFAARFVRHLGCRTSFAAFVVLLAMGSVVFLLPASVGLYSVARLASGAALSGLYLLIESRLNAIATAAARSRLLSAYMIVFYLAQALGSSFATVQKGEGSSELLAAVILILACAVGLGSFPTIIVPTLASKRLGAVELLKLSPDGYAVGLASGTLLGCFYGLGPLFAQATLSKVSLSGLFMSVAMIGSIPGLLIAGTLADRFGARKSAAGSSLASAITSLMLVAATHAGDVDRLIMAALFGAAAFSLYPLGSACVNSVAPFSMRTAANALYILTAGIGGTLGPLLAAPILSVACPGAAFIVIAAATLGTGILILLLPKFERRRTADKS